MIEFPPFSIVFPSSYNYIGEKKMIEAEKNVLMVYRLP